MKEFNRPYALQFLNTPWDKFAQQWEEKQYLHHKKYHDERPGMGLDLYHGADKTQYDPERHGEHQYYKNLPSVTNGCRFITSLSRTSVRIRNGRFTTY
jgi:hypothetical protein